MYRKLASLVVACALMTIGALAALTSPAAAAAEPKFIYSSYNYKCLDQHFNASGQATTTAWMWDCHYGTNQQWVFKPWGTNTFKLVNVRSGWCLSAPENSGDKVFAEVCVSNAAKQVWGTSVSIYGHNVLAVQRSGASCMYMRTGTDLGVVPNKIPAECRGDLSTYNWYWHDAG